MRPDRVERKERSFRVTRPASRSKCHLLAVALSAALTGCVTSGNVVTWSELERREPKELGPREARIGATPGDEDVVRVPAGCFQMGSDDGDHDERPPHEVCLSVFYIDRLEVSNGRYAQCVAAGVCRAPDRYPERPELSEADRPVVGVSWLDADRYCQWVGMRLPTDAEWELAAAGTDGRQYPWGNELPSCDRAVYAHCPPHSTVAVDSYPEGASPYGALHMAGNAWEWVADWWAPYYYRRSPRQDPPGPEIGRMRSIRGGCWNRSLWHLRVADRDSGVVGLRNDHVGFRCARSERDHVATTYRAPEGS